MANSNYNPYNGFTTEEANSDGVEFEAHVIGTRDYPLTEGKTYTITTVGGGIFDTCPLCTVIADDGRKHTCHITRFKKITNE